MKIKPFDQQYSKYYNLLYADKNYHQEVDYVVSVLKHYHPQAKDLLEYGSGTGGHATLLKESGYNVFGVERSSEMASVARERGVECEVADIADFKLERKFDACISLFHVISYITSNEKLIKVFSLTKAHLKTGGIFVFDVWYTPAVLHQVPETRVKKIENDEVAVTRIAVPEIDYVANIVGVNYEIVQRDKKTGNYSEFNELHNMRHFGVPEIELIAQLTGFELVKAEEFLTGKLPSNDTWGVNFILRSV